jgi:hypothetical protein
MTELVTRTDLEGVRRELDASIGRVRSELEASIGGLRNELVSTRQHIEAAMDNLSLRLTIRLGGMVAAAVAILATIIKL